MNSVTSSVHETADLTLTCAIRSLPDDEKLDLLSELWDELDHTGPVPEWHKEELDCRLDDWYESKRVGLGDDFVGEVDAAFARALEAPQSFPIVYRTLRRVVVRRFPYLVYFRQEVDVVRVFGVLHGHRGRKILRRRTPR